MTFAWNGSTLTYEDSDYNSSRFNERAVEIPIAKRFLRGLKGDGLEVGNVLNHYGVRKTRRVVDLNERGDGVENIDVFEIAGAYDWIVSISTLEHVHWDRERDPTAGPAALEHLRGLLKPGGQMLLTVPMGHHPPLDAVLLGGVTDRAWTLVRDGDGWVQTSELTAKPYGATTMWAESVWIGEFDG